LQHVYSWPVLIFVVYRMKKSKAAVNFTALSTN